MNEAALPPPQAAMACTHACIWVVGTETRCYPPARWRGGSSDAAKLRSEGWGAYACSESEAGAQNACSEQAAPPTPNPSPPLASLAGGGDAGADAWGAITPASHSPPVPPRPRFWSARR